VIPHSIRRRLPLSYAAIALLAALALGAALLLILRGYYLRVEREYLRSNAQAIAVSLGQLLEEDAPDEVLQAQLDNFSLLSDTRVQLLDAEGQWVASSESPGRFPFPFTRWTDILLPGDREFAERMDRIRALLNTVLGDVASESTPDALSTPKPTLPEEVQRATPQATGRSRVIAIERSVPLEPGAEGSDIYSSQVVQQPIRDSGDNLLGFVELSQGPAYAREIVDDVARGWAIASAVAVVVAAAVGWWISQRISSPLLALTEVTASMAEGDLDARADVSRQDEIGTLAHAYNQMADRVQDTIVTLQRFVSDAAHEIHTPLTALRTNLELARDDAPAESKEHLAQAQAQVERLEALTAGLLDLSRLESRADAQDLQPVSLLPLLEEVGERYASQAEQAGLAFELSLPEESVVVRGNAGQLQRALANLLDNAIKFTPQGCSIRLGLRREGQMAVVWVEDTGMGIPAQDLPHLFQRFHRGRNAAAYPGSGLGLAIVKAIAERHAGHIEAESSGQGARFTLSLPLA
jgi:signal transduction histidine kinase